jgi:hypothetical protein
MMGLSSVGWFGLYCSAPVGRLHYAGQLDLELVGLLIVVLFAVIK